MDPNQYKILEQLFSVTFAGYTTKSQQMLATGWRQMNAPSKIVERGSRH